jgi:uncharacterized membrane protein SpoIIM required for sporulation
MNLDEFLRQRRPSWQQLEALLAQAKTNFANLDEREVQELGRLYRAATSDLALAQRDFARQDVAIYLNQLVGRAHALIYSGEPLRWRQLAIFYQNTYPQLYRALLPYTIVAFALFTLAAVAAFLVVWQDPDAIYVIEGPEIWTLVKEVEEGKMWTEIPPAVRSAASAAILTNNIQVTFFAFAGGMAAGLVTLWVMILNGLHLGGIFGLLYVHGMAGRLAEFVIAHGVVELSIIFLAGGCGLYLGSGLVLPGLQSRAAAMAQRGRIAVQLILGSAPLLVASGLVEGYISPSGLPWWVKGSVGVGTGILLYLYWLLGGKEKAAKE